MVREQVKEEPPGWKPGRLLLYKYAVIVNDIETAHQAKQGAAFVLCCKACLNGSQRL